MPQFDLSRGLDFAQYIQGHSPFHRLHPGSKMIVVLAFMAGIIIVPGPGGLFAFLVLLNLVLLAAGTPAAIPYGSAVRVLPLLAIIVVLQVLTVPGYHWGQRIGSGFFSLYSGEVFAALITLLRFGDLVLLLSLFASFTRIGELSYATEALASPLARIGFPAREVALTLTIALYFLPLFGVEADRILKSQASRGAELSAKGLGLIRRVRAFFPLFVPLMILSLRHAENLGRAMEARLFAVGARHTRLNEYPLRALDVAAGILVLCLIPLAIVNPFRNIDLFIKGVLS